MFPAFLDFPGFLNRIWPLLFLQDGTQARSGSWPALWRFGFSLAFCIQLDTFGKMNVLVQSPLFSAWLTALKDLRGKAHILNRLQRASAGNFGDCESVGDGVQEMRIHDGPGYRVYFTRRGEVLYFLLLGGDKRTQSKDIAKAKAMLATLPKENP